MNKNISHNKNFSKNYIYTILLLALFIFFNNSSFAQLIHVENIDLYSNAIEKNSYNLNNDSTTQIHSAIKPLYISELKQNSSFGNKQINLCNCTYFRNLPSIAPKTSHFTIKPLVNVLPGFSSSNSSIVSENNVGFSFSYIYSKMNVNTKKISDFAFNLSYMFGISDFPNYMQSQIKKTHIITGQGYANNLKWGYQYHNLSFYATKNAGKHFVFETGFGKHFWGDGYRSLFLSDAAFSYPYFKITTTVRNLKYINLWANFKDITQSYNNWFDATNKYVAFHFLSWNATKRLNINLFEAIIWK